MTDQDWIRESAFGEWFLRTDTWANHVLKIALDELESLMTPRLGQYPTILDVGIGFGHSLPILDQKFQPQRIIGLDVDPAVPERNTRKAEACACDVEFITSNAASIELPDTCVDMILCHQTFHHIVDQARAAKEFLRVLRPGGVLLFAESCKKYIHSLPIRLLFRHPMDVQKTDAEYLQLLQQSGFVMRPENVSRPYLWWSRMDLGLLERLGKKPRQEREETLVYVAAYRPDGPNMI